MKKLTLACALILTLALAFACGKKKEEPAPAEPAATEQPAAAPEQPAAAEQPAASAAGSKSFRYVLEASGPGTPKMRFEYLVVPPKMHVKMITDQGAVNIVSDGVNYWMVQDATKMAIKMPAESKPEVPDQMVFSPDWADFQQSKVAGYSIEDQGKSQVNGKELNKYLVKDPTGKSTMTVYVDGGNTIRRIETTAEGQAQSFIMDIIELEMNPASTDADFQPPAGYTIQEIPAMPKQ